MQGHTNFRQKCKDCSKIFYNGNCYAHHLQNVCRLEKRCEKCGVIYRLKNANKKGRKGHTCGEKYCQACQDYHEPKRGCYIKKLEVSQEETVRIICFDTETCQSKKLRANGSDDSNVHEVNFICARVLCTKCISKDMWNQQDRSCEICGEHTLLTWAHISFANTAVDKHTTTTNPIDNFLHWLLYGLTKNTDQ